MRPIVLSTESVKAIREGRKTQTRRSLKPQPPEDSEFRYLWCDKLSLKWPLYAKFMNFVGIVTHISCPYGSTGDRLWVKEAWRPILFNGGTGMYGNTVSEYIEYKASEGFLLNLKCTRAQSGLSYVGDPLPKNYLSVFSKAGWWSTKTGGEGLWRSPILCPVGQVVLLLK